MWKSRFIPEAAFLYPLFNQEQADILLSLLASLCLFLLNELSPF